MNNIQHLLDRVADIKKKNTEILDATGGRFNMFRVCGVNHYENTHSAIIAEFLNPNGTHGLKSKLLECFVETLGKHFTIQDFDYRNARVHTEYSTSYGRIDILIEDNQNKAIIIENKVYADDQWEQLKRYNQFAANTYKESNYQILYLTLFGDDASEQSSKGTSYLPISHKETIINWLEKCVAIAARAPIVRETIIQYINHLKQLTNQDMDTKNKEEIVNILSNVENLKAAQAIVQNYAATFNYLAQKHFNPKMEEFAKQKGLEYHYVRSEETYVQFSFTNPNWEGKYWIGFTFEGNRCHYGLCNNFNNYKISSENRKIIHERLLNLGIVSPKESPWWPFYAYFPNLTLDSWENDIIKSDNFFNDCKDKIEQLLTVMEGIEL